ncbi:putative Zn finger protein [Haloarcula quadrata]|uniref:Putative Zn finger protein n=1 Tax=Haloarcula quadrata TaxID=182779 RepID=A0A495QR13_9EURY|nr:SWIM zinc finger family protein [Haloarcula quadrata]RKS75926.1 putative Zn finger protein [Haloarcula quadrata]
MNDGEWPPLTEATIRELARSNSYQRGQSYYEQGAVSDVVRRGDRVRADVEGSQYQPYTITIEFQDAGVDHTDCSCPYDHGGICKHRVAVLLTCLRDPERVRAQPPLSDLLADADRETLEELLVELAAERPDVSDWFETRLETSAVADEAATDESVSVNLESIQRQAKHTLPKPGQRGHNDAYAEAQRMAGELDELLEQARLAIEADDGETALDVLEAITEVLVTNKWTGLLPHDVSDLFETIDDLGELFVEAVLTAGLPEEERADWEQQLREWDEDTTFAHFMGGTVLGAAADAVIEGWDDDRVQQALEGDLDHGEFGEDSQRWHAPDVVDVRLRILARQDRHEAYLNLSRAAGADLAHAEMLVEVGRIENAVEYGVDHLLDPESLLSLAQTLREQGHTDAAFTVAEHGLTVKEYGQDTLAEWLRDRAASAGEDDLALEAAITAFETSPSVSAFEAVEELAADDWETIKTDLLEYLRTEQPGGRTAARAAEVFIREGEYDDAITLAKRSSRTSVIEPVVEAVTEERPDWVVRTCKAQAEPIVEQGKHDSYETAVRWLRRAGEAAQAADELDEWREYVETVRDKHYQKYKLRPMLDDLLEEF